MQWSCPAARKPWVLQSPAAFLWQCFHALCELLEVFFFLRWCTGATWRVQRGWKITGPCHKTGSSLSTKEKDQQTSENLQPKSINSCIVVLCSLLSLSCEFAAIFSFGYLEFSQFLPQFVFWFWSFFFPEITLINPGTFYELVFPRFLLYFFLKSMLERQSKRNEITKELCSG